MTTSTRGRLVAVVQARMGSSRLSGKVMADIGGKPAIQHLLERLGQAQRIHEIWLACSDRPENSALADLVAELGVKVFRGDEHDVLGRYYSVGEKSGADGIVRITGDCPLVDPGIVDMVAEAFQAGTADFCSNTLRRSFPDGLDVEIFTREALIRAYREARDPFLRQHVTPYIHGRLADRFPSGGFSTQQVVWPQDYSQLRWTLDEPADLDFIRRIFSRLPAGFSWQDVLALCLREPELLLVNRMIPHNEGTRRDLSNNDRSYDVSNQLFERASRSIPLASQTFSKSHQQWVRGATPLFLDRGHGSRVWDVDGNSYIDYVLGLLPIILGYCDPDVDAAVLQQTQKGVTFSLPTRLEMEVAERLIRLIPCAEKVRFGKNGSDVTTAAIRLARANTGRSKVAMAGYHGWHDWYIGTTTRHAGVPDAIRALSETFTFNDADSLERLLMAEPDAYAAIILEPAGATPPTLDFLQRVRQLADQYGAVLVFDEIITGFRINLGGAQAEYGVIPDLACFGKAMANGLPISAVVGRADIMNDMEDIFFSGTFGGEALSLAAAAATIDKLEREAVVPRLRRLGHNLIGRANAAIERQGMNGLLRVSDVDWWPRLVITSPPIDQWLLVSLLRQEFVARGLLLGASFNLCLAQDDPAVVTDTVAAFEAGLAAVREYLSLPAPDQALRGIKVQPTFSIRH